MSRLFRRMLTAASLLVFLWGGMEEITNGQEIETFELKNYQWKNRILLIFAPAADDPARRSLMTEMDNRLIEVRDRELLIGEILETGASQFGGAPLPAQSAEALRKRFSIRKGQFTVILIGKDGETKLRREAPAQAAEIFALIDSMPMRQREMRERK